MRVGGQDDARYLFPRHWERLANDLDMKPSFLAERAQEMIDRVLAAVEPAAQGLDLQREEFAVIENIAAVIDRGKRRLAGLLGS